MEKSQRFEIRGGKLFHLKTRTYHDRPNFNHCPPEYCPEYEQFDKTFYVFSTRDSVSQDHKIYKMFNKKYRGFLLSIIYNCVQNVKTAEYYNNLDSSLHKFFQERHLLPPQYSLHIQNIKHYARELNQIMDTPCDTPCETPCKKESLLNETKEALERYCLNMKFPLSQDEWDLDSDSDSDLD
jgi:hypothetical protein